MVGYNIIVRIVGVINSNTDVEIKKLNYEIEAR
jgi:hypothetical protein